MFKRRERVSLPQNKEASQNNNGPPPKIAHLGSGTDHVTWRNAFARFITSFSLNIFMEAILSVRFVV